MKIQRIMVRLRTSLSVPVYYHRSAHWIVEAGTATVVNWLQELRVNTRKATDLPAGYADCLLNPSVIHRVILGVQSRYYFEAEHTAPSEDACGYLCMDSCAASGA
jgi:mannose-6-phosphate isomerase-like protein (cupin superfamily)